MSYNKNTSSVTKSDMTKEDSSRVQSTQAKGDNDMSSSGFASRAQSAGDRHDNAGAGGQGTAHGNHDGDDGHNSDGK